MMCPALDRQRQANEREDTPEFVELWPAFSYVKGMNRELVIATLRAHEPELRHRGVLHAALFGSMARDEATPASDIDLLIDIDPEANIDLLDYVGITQYIGGLFPSRVDIANHKTLKPLLRPSAERDAVYAF